MNQKRLLKSLNGNILGMGRLDLDTVFRCGIGDEDMKRFSFEIQPIANNFNVIRSHRIVLTYKQPNNITDILFVDVPNKDHLTKTKFNLCWLEDKGEMLNERTSFTIEEAKSLTTLATEIARNVVNERTLSKKKELER